MADQPKPLIIETQLFEYKKIESKDGKFLVRGILQRKGSKNQNGRIYPDEVLMREVVKFQKMIDENRAMGELDHPESPIVNLKNVSHIVRDLAWDGDDLVGTIEVLNTPNGEILKNLLNSNVKIGVSSRGTGSLKKLSESSSMVNDDFELICFDVVSNPSTHGAFLFCEGKAPVRIVNNDNLTEVDTFKSRMMRAAGIVIKKKETPKTNLVSEGVATLQRRAGISVPNTKIISELNLKDYNADKGDEMNDLMAVETKLKELYPNAEVTILNGSVHIAFKGFDGFIHHLIPKSGKFDFTGKWQGQDFEDQNQSLDDIVQSLDLPYNKVFNDVTVADVEEVMNELVNEIRKDDDAKERVMMHLYESLSEPVDEVHTYTDTSKMYNFNDLETDDEKHAQMYNKAKHLRKKEGPATDILSKHVDDALEDEMEKNPLIRKMIGKAAEERKSSNSSFYQGLRNKDAQNLRQLKKSRDYLLSKGIKVEEDQEDSSSIPNDNPMMPEGQHGRYAQEAGAVYENETKFDRLRNAFLRGSSKAKETFDAIKARQSARLAGHQVHTDDTTEKEKEIRNQVAKDYLTKKKLFPDLDSPVERGSLPLSSFKKMTSGGPKLKSTHIPNPEEVEKRAKARAEKSKMSSEPDYTIEEINDPKEEEMEKHLRTLAAIRKGAEQSFGGNTPDVVAFDPNKGLNSMEWHYHDKDPFKKKPDTGFSPEKNESIDEGDAYHRPDTWDMGGDENNPNKPSNKKKHWDTMSPERRRAAEKEAEEAEKKDAEQAKKFREKIKAAMEKELEQEPKKAAEKKALQNVPQTELPHKDIYTDRYRAELERKQRQKAAKDYLDKQLFHAKIQANDAEMQRRKDYAGFDPIIENEEHSEIDWDTFEQQLAKGIEVEHEHTDDPSVAAEIALDHLNEDPHYYDKLTQCGLETEAISREEAKRDQTGRKKWSRLDRGEDPRGTLENNRDATSRQKNKKHGGLTR